MTGAAEFERDEPRSPERIAVLTTSYPSYPGDPSGHFVESEVAALRAAGHQVTVLAPRVEGAAVRVTTGVSFLSAGSAFGWPGAVARMRRRPIASAIGALRFVQAARRALGAIAADRVVAHFLLPCAFPIAAPSRRRHRLEVVAHGSDVRLFARLPASVRRRVAAALEGAELRCVSAELAAELARALGPGHAARIRVAPCALDVSAAPPHSLARERLGLDARRATVVVVGRLVREKRVSAALRAAHAVPGAEAIVVGDGPERAAVEREFPDARFVGRVSRSEALTWISAADLLISASPEEGSPTVVREARALGTPVVAVRAGDLIERSVHDPWLWVVGTEATTSRRCAP